MLNHHNDEMPSKAIKEIEDFKEEITLLEVLARTVQQWPLIILSLTIFLGLGIFYLLVTPKTYTQYASLLIKEDSEGGSAGSMLNDFSNLGLFASNSNVQNEMETLKSPDLMEEVVDNLDLMTTYYVPNRFHKKVAYGTTLPIKVFAPDLPPTCSARYKIIASPDRKVIISDIKIKTHDGEKINSDENYVGTLGKPIMTVAGPLTVNTTAFYKPLDENLEISVVHVPRETAIRNFSKKLTVDIENQYSTVIELSLKDNNIERADSVLSMLIDVYNGSWIADKKSIANQTSRFINDRLNVIETELGHVDSDISSYKSTNLVPDITLTAKQAIEEEQKLSEDILKLTNQLQSLYRIRASLSNKTTDPTPLPANTGLDDTSIQKQISDYNQRVLDRNRLIAQSSDRNPLVNNIERDIAGLGAAISGAVDNAIHTIETEIKGLQRARGETTSRLASNPTQAKYLLSVERQQKVKENLYLFLLQKREDNELSQAFTSYSNRVIRRPGGDTKPTSPRTIIVLGACSLLGLVCPFLFIFLRENLNTRVRGRQDVKGVKIPLIGEIPETKNQKTKGNQEPKAVVKAGRRDFINEAFRVLRTNIEFARVNKDGCNVLSFTSFNPSSGKTFISYNLATALALKKKRILLIDADLRTGSASTYVGNPELGLAQYLDGQFSDVNNLLVTPDGFPELQVLPIGQIPPTPTELMERPEFGKLIEEMRLHYDYIIIDCPPINIVADAKIVDQFTDRSIFVIRAGLMERSGLPMLDQLNEEGTYRRMAFILNGVPLPHDRFGRKGINKYAYGNAYGTAYGTAYGA